MRKLIGFFEQKAVELKPKVRYAWWVMGIVCALLFGIMLFLSQRTSLPEWSAYLLMPFMVVLMIIMTWTWGLILICSWFKPNRKAKFFVIEAYQAIMLVIWFTTPITGFIWLYVLPKFLD